MRIRIASAVLAFAAANHSWAIERIVFEADEIVSQGARASNVAVTLNLNGAPSVQARAPRISLPQPAGLLKDFALDCTDLVIKEPELACRAAHVRVQGGPTGSIDAQAFATYDTKLSLLKFGVDRLVIAGGRAQLNGSFGADGWSLRTEASGLQPTPLRALAKPWVQIPDTFTVTGTFGAQLQASGRGENTRFDGTLRTTDFGFSNEEGTIVAEKVAAAIRAKGSRSAKNLSADAQVTGSAGQMLTGPVLLDFRLNPLHLTARGALKGEVLELDALSIAQKSLLNVRGNGRVRFGEKPSLERAHVEIDSLELPAAYTSFAQLTLATTDFGSLQTSGRASGVLDIVHNRPQLVSLKLDGLNLEDTKGKFSMADIRGEIYWIDDPKAPAPSSYLSWRKGSAYGLSGADARIDFRAQGLNIELTRESRLPLFDGAVLIRSLALRELGKPEAEFQFDAQIEPISMPLVSKAFGWPELQGELSGRIPGLSYRNRELTVQGDLSARVFDGTIVGRNFRLRDPLGPWPRLFADVTARSLDLELVTRTFPIGNITGRLDTDIKGLELFNWSPVAFDARLYTTPGDRSKHLISQKAVTSISNVGGGGGGVTAALQSGVLRFFDDFRYDRIGLSCKLQNEVCVMSGIERAGMGYYIVKGRGLPRIDIIGNQGRVDWPLLVSQIEAGMRSNNVIVR